MIRGGRRGGGVEENCCESAWKRNVNKSGGKSVNETTKVRRRKLRAAETTRLIVETMSTILEVTVDFAA